MHKYHHWWVKSRKRVDSIGYWEMLSIPLSGMKVHLWKLLSDNSVLNILWRSPQSKKVPSPVSCSHSGAFLKINPCGSINDVIFIQCGAVSTGLFLLQSLYWERLLQSLFSTAESYLPFPSKCGHHRKEYSPVNLQHVNLPFRFC